MTSSLELLRNCTSPTFSMSAIVASSELAGTLIVIAPEVSRSAPAE